MQRPVLALIITNVIWGAAAPIFKYALGNIPPFTLAFIRFFCASLIFFPLAYMQWKSIRKRDVLTICLAAFFGMTLSISFFYLGLQRGISINMPIIGSGGPIVLYILAIIFLKEKPQKKVFMGMLVALIGVLTVVVSPILAHDTIVSGEVIGNLLFMAATVCSVLDPLVAKRVLDKVSAYQFTFIGFTFASLTFLFPAFYELQSWNINQLTGKGMVGIIYGIVFSSAIAYFCLYWGLSKIKAQEVGIFTYIDPLAAIIIAVPLLHEYPTPQYILGALLVFAGIFIAENRIHWHPFHKLRVRD